MSRSQMIERNAKDAAAFFEGLTRASEERISAIKAEGAISARLSAVLAEDAAWRARESQRRAQRKARKSSADTQRQHDFQEWKAAEIARLAPDASKRRSYASGRALDALPTPHPIHRDTEEIMRDRKARLTYFKALQSAAPERIQRIIAEASKPFSMWVLEHATGPNPYSPPVDAATAARIDQRLAERNGHGHRVHLYVKGQIRPVRMTSQRALEIAIQAAENIETGNIPADLFADLIRDGL